MRKLERTRDFGTFKGQPFIPPGCDRVAVYEQDGQMFDVADREIVPGVSLAQAREQRRQTNQYSAEAAAELLAHAGELSPAVFKSMAKILLGAKKCPSKKADIVAALEAMVAKSEASAPMKDEEADAPVQGDSAVSPAGKAPEANGHKGMTGAKPPPTKPSPPPSPQRKNGVNVDLAAWARGQKQYAFHAIREAIEERLGVAVTDANAALEAVIDKGLIAFKDARADLLPPAVEVEDHEDA